ncbi:hypothetical protein ACPXAC_06275, partial [Escherichia coli]
MDFPQRVNGWALYAHPCFQETYDALVAEVETLGNDSNLLIVFYVQIMPDD